jgi:membrane-associated protease RseP (regulator of RpoE activity)
MFTIRIKVLNKIYNRLGAFRAARPISWAALITLPIVAGLGLYLILNSLSIQLLNPAAREIGRELGPTAYILIPGINPFLPILSGWIAIVSAIVVHEGAHGVIAASRGFKVKSSGLLFFLVIPVGAFVDIDEKQIEKAKAKESLKVMAAGVGANVALATVCILGILVITSGLTPVIDGVYILEIAEGKPAKNAGLLVGDVFVKVDGIPIAKYEDLEGILEDKIPGDIVNVTVARGKMWKEEFSTSVNLSEYEGRAILGITVSEILPEKRLRLYGELTLDSLYKYWIPPALAPGLVPFSEALNIFYTSPLGENWHVIANILFWLWFVNSNVAIFNSLPIYPLDGGRVFKIASTRILGKRADEKTISRLTYFVTVTLICLFLIGAALPFVM